MSLSRYQYGIWHEKASPAELFFEYHHAARRIPSGQERASRRPRRPAADRALCGPAHLVVPRGTVGPPWRVKSQKVF